MTFLIILGYMVIVALFVASACLVVFYIRFIYYGIGYTYWALLFWFLVMLGSGYVCYALAPFSVILKVPA